jgi:hypothetical protein
MAAIASAVIFFIMFVSLLVSARTAVRAGCFGGAEMQMMVFVIMYKILIKRCYYQFNISFYALKARHG